MNPRRIRIVTPLLLAACLLLFAPISLAGIYKYQREDGSDVFLDSDGFPWAIQIPTAWNWPVEREKIWDGYAGFQPWYMSSGQTNRDWYLTAEDGFVYPYIQAIGQSGLTAYLSAVSSKNKTVVLISLVIALLALGIIFGWKRFGRAKQS